METDWMEDGETIEESCLVFLGQDGPASAKITGKLVVTNKNVHFRADLELDENAGFKIGPSYSADMKIPFRASEKHVKIPHGQITDVTVTKAWLILKTLKITVEGGASLDIRFGTMSPAKAEAAIKRHIGAKVS